MGDLRGEGGVCENGTVIIGVFDSAAVEYKCVCRNRNPIRIEIIHNNRVFKNESRGACPTLIGCGLILRPDCQCQLWGARHRHTFAKRHRGLNFVARLIVVIIVAGSAAHRDAAHRGDDGIHFMGRLCGEGGMIQIRRNVAWDVFDSATVECETVRINRNPVRIQIVQNSRVFKNELRAVTPTLISRRPIRRSDFQRQLRRARHHHSLLKGHRGLDGFADLIGITAGGSAAYRDPICRNGRCGCIHFMRGLCGEGGVPQRRSVA